MAKKFGKFILAATAITTAAAAAYYLSKKNNKDVCLEDEDLDDFSDDADDETERKYVELDMDGTEGKKKVDIEEITSKASATIAGVANKVAETANRVMGRTIEKVEDFFDDEDDETLADKVADAAEDLADKASDAAEDLADKADDLADKAADAVDDLTDKAADAAENLADKAEKIAEDVAEKADGE